MGLVFRKQKENFKITKVGKIALIGFIVSLASSFIGTIWAVYLDSFVNNEAIVGFLTSFLTAISFFSYFIFIPLIEKVSKSKIYRYSLLLFALVYFLIAINRNLYFLIFLAGAMTILGTLRVTSFGIIIKDKAPKKKLSRSEGMVYTFCNLSWVVGPLIAGYLSEAYGFSFLFMLAMIFLLVAFLFFKVSKIKDKNITKNVDGNLVRNFLDFFKNKKRVYAYLLGGGVNLWWVLIYIFVPLEIIRHGLGTLWVGYFLFAVAVPLIIFEFHFSKLAEKIGYKKIFIIGFLIPAIGSLICFFVGNIYLMLGILVLSSVGLAMIEPTTEAYFFDTIKKKEECRFYGPYNTTIEVNDFVAKILSATILVFLPFKFVFILFAGVMFLFVGLSSKIKDKIK